MIESGLLWAFERSVESAKVKPRFRGFGQAAIVAVRRATDSGDEPAEVV